MFPNLSNHFSRNESKYRSWNKVSMASSFVSVVSTLVLGSSTAFAVWTQDPAQATDQSALIINASIDERLNYNIQSQPLRQALLLYGEHTGLQISADPATVAGVNAPAIEGKYTPQEALKKLLSGTNLSLHYIGKTSVVVSRPNRVYAQAGDGAQLDTIVVDSVNEIEDGKYSADKAYETAGSVKVISEEQIQRHRGSSVGDFLQGTPGVLTGDNRNSGAVDINIRGVQGFNRVPVVIDGTQQSNTVYRGYSGVASRNYVDPDMIGGVSIEKGPSAGRDGAGAIGGVAYMRTLMVHDILKEGESFGVRLKGGLSGNSNWLTEEGTLRGGPDSLDRPSFLDLDGKSGSIAIAKHWEHLDLLAAFTKRKTGNYYAGEKGEAPKKGSLNQYIPGEEVLNSQIDNHSYLLKATGRAGDGHSLELSYMKYESDFGEIMPSIIIRFDGATQAPMSHVEVDTYYAKYNWKPVENELIDFQANLWKTHTDTKIVTPYYFSYPGFSFDATQAYEDISNRWGINVSNTSRLDTGFGSLKLEYGASHVHETLRPPEEKRATNFDSGDLLASRDGWRHEQSAFIAAEWKPTDWLKFNASGRYTKTHSYDNRTPYGKTTHSEQKHSGFAPIAAVTIEPFKGLQFYTKYAEATRAASLYESTVGFSQNAYSAYGNPTPELERAKNWEYGMNFMKDSLIAENDKFRMKLAYFNNHIDNYLDRQQGNWVVNLDYAEFKGIEFSSSYDAGFFFGDFSAIEYRKIQFCAFDYDRRNGGFLTDQPSICSSGGATGGYTHLHVPPSFTVSATLGVRLFDEKLTLGSRLTKVGKRASLDLTSITGGTSKAVDWEPYQIIDLFASYKFNDTFKLDVGIDNVEDIYYMDTLTIGLMPSPGRTFHANLTANF